MQNLRKGETDRLNPGHIITGPLELDRGQDRRQPAIISKYLAREWGISMAREAMLSGREITPDEMLRWGAIHGITSDGQSLNAKLDEYLCQLQRCAPRSAATNKELVRLGWYAPESKAQANLVNKTFGEMMAPGSEGEHGIRNFQNKVKGFSWREISGEARFDRS